MRACESIGVWPSDLLRRSAPEREFILAAVAERSRRESSRIGSK